MMIDEVTVRGIASACLIVLYIVACIACMALNGSIFLVNLLSTSANSSSRTGGLLSQSLAPDWLHEQLYYCTRRRHATINITARTPSTTVIDYYSFSLYCLSSLNFYFYDAYSLIVSISLNQMSVTNIPSSIVLFESLIRFRPFSIEA